MRVGYSRAGGAGRARLSRPWRPAVPWRSRPLRRAAAPAVAPAAGSASVGTDLTRHGRAGGRRAPTFRPSAAHRSRPTSSAATPSGRPARSRRRSCRSAPRRSGAAPSGASRARRRETAVGRDDALAHGLHRRPMGPDARRRRSPAAALRARRQRMAAGCRRRAHGAAAAARRRACPRRCRPSSRRWRAWRGRAVGSFGDVAAARDRLAKLAGERWLRPTAEDFDNYGNLTETARIEASRKNFGASEDHYRRALAILTNVFGEQSPGVGLLLMELALQISNQERFDEAAALFRRADPIIQTNGSAADRARLLLYQAFDAANRGRFDEALEFADNSASTWRGIVSQGGDGADQLNSRPGAVDAARRTRLQPRPRGRDGAAHRQPRPPPTPRPRRRRRSSPACRTCRRGGAPRC